MNKTTIKSFAIRARQQLLEGVRQRACSVGFQTLAEEIRSRGYEQVLEEAAYFWFSRLTALRFMEVNGFLPVRVFADENGSFQPRLLKEAMQAHQAVSACENDELQYRHLLIALCNDLEKRCPHLFPKLPEWAALLLPENLQNQDSVLGQLIREIPEEAFADRVQVLGWLYQHYNTERKDEIFAQLKKNIKITKEHIPTATQLFTPEWIVRYLVENSLGRIYIRHELSRHPKPLTESERLLLEQQLASNMGWRYYLPEEEQSLEARRQLSAVDAKSFNVTALKIIDPCMGSGHILVYAFDVLMQIYKACGWSEQNAARSILENNLYGMDIDDRAEQLSCFGVLMKAGKYDPDLLNGEIRPHVYSVADSCFMTDALIAEVAAQNKAVQADLLRLRSAFQNAGEYGSLLEAPQLDYEQLRQRIAGQTGKAQLLPLIGQAQLLSQKYAVVVTNPPYMGAGSMSHKLRSFVKDHYPHSKSDLFAVFMERCTRMTEPGGYQAMITQHAWMFLGSFEKLRKKLLAYDLINMAHLGPRAFGQIPGSVVQTVSFVLRNTHTEVYTGTYCRLTAPVNQRGKEKLFLSGECRYYAAQNDFSRIPGSPVAYWLSRNMLEVFSSNQTVGSIARPKQGIATANNSRYLRLWHECRKEDIFFDCTSHRQSATDPRKWYPYNKGGQSRKWYGNDEYVINWHCDGLELSNDPKAVIRNPQFFFKSCVSWSLVSPGIPAFRFKPEGQLFDVAGMCCFSEEYLYDLLALFNSKVAFEMLKVLSPTINYQCGDIANIPVKPNHSHTEAVEQFVRSNIALCKEDWDAFEVSREFKKHPLI